MGASREAKHWAGRQREFRAASANPSCSLLWPEHLLKSPAPSLAPLVGWIEQRTRVSFDPAAVPAGAVCLALCRTGQDKDALPFVFLWWVAERGLGGLLGAVVIQITIYQFWKLVLTFL